MTALNHTFTHYTCLSCFSVVTAPDSGDTRKAKCPKCSPDKEVEQKRGRYTKEALTPKEPAKPTKK
jgi:uncharacterized paraquat-inducible protein A